MKLTVIVPVYNVGLYLERCLNSLINQTYHDLEIIIVNDGSTDNSQDIIEQFSLKDKRIKAIKQDNQGLSAARNAGLSIATGDYITFVDSDDWLAIDIYEHVIGLIEEYHQGIDIVHFDAIKAYGNSPAGKDVQKDIRQEYFEGREVQQKFFGLKGKLHGISCWSKVYINRIVKDLRFPVGKMSEDIIFNFQAFCRAENCLETSKVGYFYFQREGSISCGKLNKRSFDCVDFWKQIEADVTDKVYKKISRERVIKNNFILLLRAATYGVKDDFGEFDRVRKQALKTFRKNILLLMKMKNLKKDRKLAAIIMFFNYNLCSIIARNYLK